MKIAAGLTLAALTFGCGAAESSGEAEVGETQAAVLGPSCNGSSVTTNCWTGTGSHQVRAFDEYKGFRWYVRATNPAMYTSVYTWDDTSGGSWPAGYLDNNGDLPSPVISVAVNLTSAIGTVYALSEDGVVHSAFGRSATEHLTSPNGSDFGHWAVSIQPFDKSGTRLSLRQIVSLHLPTNFGQGVMLLALDFAGRVYVQDAIASGERRWMPAAQHPGFSGLPTSVTWTEISRVVGGGAYLLANSGVIYQAATGTITSSDGTVTWNPVVALPRIVVSGPFGLPVILSPAHVGGRYVITNVGSGSTCTVGVGCSDDRYRFVRFDPATSHWQVVGGGVPFVPTSTSDLMEAPFNKQIWDTGSGFAVKVPFTHVSTYHL